MRKLGGPLAVVESWARGKASKASEAGGEGWWPTHLDGRIAAGEKDPLGGYAARDGSKAWLR